ncbi:hypothetical protein [Candidatus Phytoplasma pyri]|uniref:hypothetical protein n=1 Tax=Candidatus Phytoplasma pyri TaxID=47566 RepID=UPI0039839A75
MIIIFTKIENQIKEIFTNNSKELKNQIQNYYYQYKRKPKGQDFEKIIADFLTNSKKFTDIKLEKGNNPEYDILINNFYKINCKTSDKNTRINLSNNLNFNKTLLIGIFSNDKINLYLLNSKIQQKYLTSFKKRKNVTQFTLSLFKLIKNGLNSIIELTILKPKSFLTFNEFLELNSKYQFIQNQIKTLTSILEIENELKTFIQINQNILIAYLNQYYQYHQKNCNSLEFEKVIFDFLNQNHNLINHIFECSKNQQYYDLKIKFYNSKTNCIQNYYLDIKTTNYLGNIRYNDNTFSNSKKPIKNSHIFTKSKMYQFLKFNPKTLLIFNYQKNTNCCLYLLNAKTQMKYHEIFFQRKNTFMIYFSLVLKKYKNTDFLKSITILENILIKKIKSRKE